MAADQITQRSGRDADQTAQVQTQERTGEQTTISKPGDRLTTDTPGGERTVTVEPPRLSVKLVIERVGGNVA